MLIQKRETVHIALVYRVGKLGRGNDLLPPHRDKKLYLWNLWLFSLICLRWNPILNKKNPAEWFNCWEVLCAVCQINYTSFSIQNEWWALRIRETALKYAWILWQWMVFNPDSGYIESQEIFCRQVALLLTPSNLS